MRLNNDNNITKITIKLSSKNRCPLGLDWYTNSITVLIVPDKYILDYRDIQTFNQENVNEKELTIEQAIDTLFQHIVAEYKPHHLKITSHVVDSNHPEVIVEKEL